MGRGTSARGLLPLAEAHVLLPENLLQLLLAEGTALDVRWGDSRATITVSGAILLAGEVSIVEMSRVSLIAWLEEIDAIRTLPYGVFPFGAYEFRWGNDSGPKLYMYPASMPISDGVFLGTVASREVLHDFLKRARSEGLF